MGAPEPIYALTGHCSVVHEDTLYVYSPAGFQSLSLEEGAEWKALPMDISLTGAQCVKGGNALYIVGGTANETAASWDYPGLMHYNFAQKKWDWIRAQDWVTQNRLKHAVSYLESTQQLLVYSGSQDSGNNDPSSSTYLISTQDPYLVRSSPSNGAPPAVRPILLPWDNRSAVMLGGGEQNTAVYLFDAETGWRDLGVTLTEPFTNQDAVQATIVTGKDGSKVLERYDMSATPNRVTRIALVDKDGKPAAPGTTVGPQSKREVSSWQAYNATNAPTEIRSGFSLAQGQDNIAVISGGNPADPLCIFNQQDNAWVNTTELFAGQQAAILSTPSSSVAPTSATPTVAASSTDVPPPAAPVNNKSRMLTVLGATLGAIFGIAAILILILFCLKYRKAKKQKAQQDGYIEKDRLSFADRGADFMKEAGGSLGPSYNHQSHPSQSSIAIVSGQAGSNHNRGLGSDTSTSGLVMKKSPLGYSEPVELSKFDLKPEPAEQGDIVRQNSGRQPPRAIGNISRSRSSGWSKYFANNEATNLANMPSGRSTYASERTSTGSQSQYTDSRMLSQAVPPLDIPKYEKFENQRVSKVQTGSPTLGHSQENLPAQPMQAELGRANSNGSMRSINGQDHYYSSAPVESWTPVDQNERPPSSTYTNSIVGDPRTRDGTSSYYPDGTGSYYGKSTYSSFYPTPHIPQNEMRDSQVTVFPGAHAPSRPVAQPSNNDDMHTFELPPRIGGAPPEGRESTVTVFPGGPPQQSGKKTEDMSWLNLGAGK